MKNPMFDKNFLYDLDQSHHKEIYAKIVALTFNEEPIEEITGQVTGGSINIDGASSIRRTCNLTLVAQDVNINDFYWGLTNKFSVYIGVKNEINKEYPDIIWFNQGIYIITSFNTSITTNNYTITISGKDKMCLLNGEIGGALPSSIDFGNQTLYTTVYREVEDLDITSYRANKYYIINQSFTPVNKEPQYIIANEEFNEGETYYLKEDYSSLETISLKTILKEMVHTYANEPYRNILINDLDECGLELLEYRGDAPIYCLFHDGDIVNTTLNEKAQCYRITDPNTPIMLRDLKDNELYHMVGNFFSDNEAVSIQFPNDDQKLVYQVAKLDYGNVAGYRPTDLVYNGELIASIGETITSVLDKIKNMLGDFEYYYDEEGHFIFQKKQTYINTSWNTIQNAGDEIYVKDSINMSSSSYSFENNNLITAFQNSPTLTNVKNDYSIWGTRKTVNGNENLVHMRYAIDKKPQFYKAMDGTIYCASEEIAEQIKEYKRKEIAASFKEKVLHFTLSYAVDTSVLDQPTQLADGSWTKGWWDIRDWHDYYVLLTGKEPKGTMKWYSHNSLEGCVQTKTVPGLEKYPSIQPELYVWLLVQHQDGNFSVNHGYGDPSDGFRVCTYYESEYADNADGYETHLVLDENGQRIQKSFINPFASCSDDHTYLEFLINNIQRGGEKVYFYNPSFPNISFFDELMEDKINQEVEAIFTKAVFKIVDWREIIYQMALDFYKYQNENGSKYIPTSDINFEKGKAYYGKKYSDGKVEYILQSVVNGASIPADKEYYEEYYSDNFLSMVAENNIVTIKDNDLGIVQKSYYPLGVTGYESYYIDMQGYWRGLYNPEALDKSSPLYSIRYTRTGGCYKDAKVWIDKEKGTFSKEKKWYPSIITNIDCDYYLPTSFYDDFYQELQQSITIGKQYDLEQLDSSSDSYEANVNKTIKLWDQYLQDFEKNKDDNFNDKYAFWNKAILEAPETLLFWIDFLDSGELIKYSIPVIGNRPKAINDKDISAIYFRETPNIIFLTSKQYTELLADGNRQTGYTYARLPANMTDLFTISAQGKSAKDKMDELLYSNLYCTENITITSVPVYYLKPNTRIFVHDEKSQINGEYIVSKITLPLTYNGTMSISATKAVDRLY